jgi:hypothetical protein
VEDLYIPDYYDSPSGEKEAAKYIRAETLAAYNCALAYQLYDGSNRTQYADKAKYFITSWATTNKKCSGGGLILSYSASAFIFAAELIWDYSGWSSSDRDIFKQWLMNVYRWECRSGISNRADWGRLGIVAMYHFLDDEDKFDYYVDVMKDVIDLSINEDGFMPEETRRGSNGIWYTYFGLAPMTAACQIILNARGVDLFKYKGTDGTGIKEALDVLYYYDRHPSEWPFYSGISKVGGPSGWPGNLFEAMIRIYHEQEWENWVTNSRPIYNGGHHHAWVCPTLICSLPTPTSDSSPSVSKHPETKTIIEGKTTTLSVNIFGDSTLSYQWKKNGIDIPESTSVL